MAQGAEATQSLEASASTYTLTIEGRSVSAQANEVIAGYVTNKKPNAVTAARRATVSSADSTANLDAAGYTGSNNFDIGNSIHLAVSCRLSVAGQSAIIFLVLYDPSDGIIGITEDYTFIGDGTYKDSSSGKYFAPIQIIDVHGASQIYPVVRVAPTSGNVDIYIEAL
jgi:hypothetical protein